MIKSEYEAIIILLCSYSAVSERRTLSSIQSTVHVHVSALAKLNIASYCQPKQGTGPDRIGKRRRYWALQKADLGFRVYCSESLG